MLKLDKEPLFQKNQILIAKVTDIKKIESGTLIVTAKNIGPRQMLTVSQAAELLGLHINTVRRWTKNGNLKCVRVGGRSDRRFSREDLERFLLEQAADACIHESVHK